MITLLVDGKLYANVYDNYNKFKADALSFKYPKKLWELTPSGDFNVVVIKQDGRLMAALDPKVDISKNKNLIKCSKKPITI